ncbi:MAG: hypothetical protein MI723_08785, partial [Caulobacterales bacterium]|nr:hypothetical protein [Caulobacterales bacterium]
APVRFTLDVTAEGGRLSGRIAEPNTFGSADALNLYAAIEGRIEGEDVLFVKTYDGSGGQTHSVTYQGRMNADGSQITGAWRVGRYDAVTNPQGRFRVTKRR